MISMESKLESVNSLLQDISLDIAKCRPTNREEFESQEPSTEQMIKELYQYLLRGQAPSTQATSTLPHISPQQTNMLVSAKIRVER